MGRQPAGGRHFDGGGTLGSTESRQASLNGLLGVDAHGGRGAPPRYAHRSR